MKKILFLVAFLSLAIYAHAQKRQVPPKTKTPVIKRDTIKKIDNMPVIKPRNNSPMPVAKPTDNAKMPIVNPDTSKSGVSLKPIPKSQKR